MATLDIRKNAEIDKILIAEKRSLHLTITSITKASGGGINFNCPSDPCNAYNLASRDEIDNLIRALEKAKEFGWV